MPSDTLPDPTAMATLTKVALRAWDADRARSIQGRMGQIGPSSLGFCRQHALLTLKEVGPTDEDRVWPATIGTAIGELAEEAMRKVHPEWLYQHPVTCTFRNGASLSGHADVVDPKAQVVWDFKTKDGLVVARKDPWSQSYDFQTWTYVRGLQQDGTFDEDRPCYQGLIYLDRSGKDDLPYAVVKRWLPTTENLIVEWIDDVIYAAKHGEDASRDIPAPVCEQICERFTACRGMLEDSHGGGVYDHPMIVNAAARYKEIGWLMKDLIEEREACRATLVGVDGIAGDWQVRWTHVDGTFQPGYDKAPYDKIDVRKVRGR